jgi:hypothetical protein
MAPMTHTLAQGRTAGFFQQLEKKYYYKVQVQLTVTLYLIPHIDPKLVVSLPFSTLQQRDSVFTISQQEVGQ